MEHHARNFPLGDLLGGRGGHMRKVGCASRGLADTMCGVPAPVRNLGSHPLAAWRPYKRHTVFESVLYVNRVKGEGTRCLIQERGDYPQPHADLPFKMAIGIPARILEELKISIQCPYREPGGRRDRKGRINRTRFRSPRLLLSSSGSASH
jgi:hypothetical protein